MNKILKNVALVILDTNSLLGATTLSVMMFSYSWYGIEIWPTERVQFLIYWTVIACLLSVGVRSGIKFQDEEVERF